MSRNLKTSNLSLFVFALLVVFSLLKAPLNIIISGSSVFARADIISYVDRFILFPLLLVILALAINAGPLRLSFRHTDLLNIAMLTFLPIITAFWRWAEGRPPSRLSVLYDFLIVTTIYWYFRNIRLNAAGFRRMLSMLFSMSVIITIGISVYLVNNGLLTYSKSQMLGMNRPQIGGSLLQSTEISNIIGCILLIGIYVWTISKKAVSKLLIIIGCLPLLYLFGLMGSIGSIASIMLLVAVIVVGRIRNKSLRMLLLLVSVVFALGVIIISNGGNNIFKQTPYVGDRIIEKIQMDYRNIMYSDLLKMVKTNWIWGNGYNAYYTETGIYPHNNILGIWAELGIVCALAYLLHFGLCIYWGYRKVLLRNKYGRRCTYVDVIGCFCMIALFIHIKGFVHDTWYDPILLLSAAAMLGLCLNPWIPSIVENEKVYMKKYGNAKSIRFQLARIHVNGKIDL